MNEVLVYYRAIWYKEYFIPYILCRVLSFEYYISRLDPAVSRQLTIGQLNKWMDFFVIIFTTQLDISQYFFVGPSTHKEMFA